MSPKSLTGDTRHTAFRQTKRKAIESGRPCRSAKIKIDQTGIFFPARAVVDSGDFRTCKKILSKKF